MHSLDLYSQVSLGPKRLATMVTNAGPLARVGPQVESQGLTIRKSLVTVEKLEGTLPVAMAHNFVVFQAALVDVDSVANTSMPENVLSDVRLPYFRLGHPYSRPCPTPTSRSVFSPYPKFWVYG